MHHSCTTRLRRKFAEAVDLAGSSTPLVPTAIVLIAAGAVLLLIVSGTDAGIGTDAIGIATIVLGGIALVLRLAATRRSQHPPTSSAG